MTCLPDEKKEESKFKCNLRDCPDFGVVLEGPLAVAAHVALHIHKGHVQEIMLIWPRLCKELNMDDYLQLYAELLNKVTTEQKLILPSVEDWKNVSTIADGVRMAHAVRDAAQPEFEEEEYIGDYNTTLVSETSRTQPPDTTPTTPLIPAKRKRKRSEMEDVGGSEDSKEGDKSKEVDALTYDFQGLFGGMSSVSNPPKRTNPPAAKKKPPKDYVAPTGFLPLPPGLPPVAELLQTAEKKAEAKRLLMAKKKKVEDLRKDAKAHIERMKKIAEEEKAEETRIEELLDAAKRLTLEAEGVKKGAKAKRKRKGAGASHKKGRARWGPLQLPPSASSLLSAALPLTTTPLTNMVLGNGTAATSANLQMAEMRAALQTQEQLINSLLETVQSQAAMQLAMQQSLAAQSGGAAAGNPTIDLTTKEGMAVAGALWSKHTGNPEWKSKTQLDFVNEDISHQDYLDDVKASRIADKGAIPFWSKRLGIKRKYAALPDKWKKVLTRTWTPQLHRTCEEKLDTIHFATRAAMNLSRVIAMISNHMLKTEATKGLGLGVLASVQRMQHMLGIVDRMLFEATLEEAAAERAALVANKHDAADFIAPLPMDDMMPEKTRIRLQSKPQSYYEGLRSKQKERKSKWKPKGGSGHGRGHGAAAQRQDRGGGRQDAERGETQRVPYEVWIKNKKKGGKGRR